MIWRVTLNEVLDNHGLRLVKQKGVYPFEYMSSFKRFFENRFPDRCKFYSSLKCECVSVKTFSMLLMFAIF